MPTYEYLCNECEHAFEAVQSLFKGSGFYKTDSRSTPASKSEAPATKAESKPAAKVESKPVTKSKE